MSHFDIAILNLLDLEGLSVDHKADRGGATNYGISLRFLKNIPDGDINGDGHVTKADIQALTPRKAVHFYRKYFWSHYKLDRIEDVQIATKALDIFVNMRGNTAAKVFQRACNELGAELVEDGVLGRQSFKALNNHISSHLMTCIRYHQWKVYKAIMRHDPIQEVFRNGWRNRAFS